MLSAQVGVKSRTTNWQMVKKLIEYVWPKDRPNIRRTVMIAVGLLVGSKLMNIAVPFFFKHIVDELGKFEKAREEQGQMSGKTMALTFVTALIIGCEFRALDRVADE